MFNYYTMNKHNKFMLSQSQIPTITKSPVSYATIVKKGNIRAASLQYRHDVLQATNRQNYINEYDRLKGMLTSNISHGNHDYDRLQRRQQELTNLFTQSFNKITPNHELYKHAK